MNLDNLRLRIRNDWRGTTALPAILCIFDELIDSHEMYVDSSSTLLTFDNIVRNCCGKIEVVNFPSDIIASVNYLLDPSINFLLTKYEYMDEHGMYELEPDDILEADIDGYLVHPHFGNNISKYKDNVIVTFSS